MPQPSSNGFVCSTGPLKALVDEGCCQQMVQNMLASGRSHSIEVVSSPNGTLEGALEPPFRGLSGAAPRCLIGARVAMHKRAHCCQGPHQNLRTDPTDRLGFGDQNPSLFDFRFSISGIKRMRAAVSPPVQMNADLSTTARALFSPLSRYRLTDSPSYVIRIKLQERPPGLL